MTGWKIHPKNEDSDVFLYFLLKNCVIFSNFILVFRSLRNWERCSISKKSGVQESICSSSPTIFQGRTVQLRGSIRSLSLPEFADFCPLLFFVFLLEELFGSFLLLFTRKSRMLHAFQSFTWRPKNAVYFNLKTLIYHDLSFPQSVTC